MTCFWDGILNRLTADDYALVGFHPAQNPRELIKLLQYLNRETPCCTWNGQKLSQKQLDENSEHVRSLDPRSIGDGYDCSISDPFLFLVSELFSLEIRHTYLGRLMHYEPCCNVQTRRVIQFGSDHGHFFSM